jgi:hypothetical protein
MEEATEDNNSPPPCPKTTFLAGKTSEAFIVHTDLLIACSPFFRELLSLSYRRHTPTTKALVMGHNTISYPDLGEFTFALYFR